MKGLENLRKDKTMLKNFRTYQLSIQFYKSCRSVKVERHLKDQLLRASSSIALNLAEGSAKPTVRDQKKFYFIAMGSLRECQAVLSLAENCDDQLLLLADKIGGHIYNLTKS